MKKFIKYKKILQSFGGTDSLKVSSISSESKDSSTDRYFIHHEILSLLENPEYLENFKKNLQKFIDVVNFFRERYSILPAEKHDEALFENIPLKLMDIFHNNKLKSVESEQKQEQISKLIQPVLYLYEDDCVGITLVDFEAEQSELISSGEGYFYINNKKDCRVPKNHTGDFIFKMYDEILRMIGVKYSYLKDEHQYIVSDVNVSVSCDIGVNNGKLKSRVLDSLCGHRLFYLRKWEDCYPVIDPVIPMDEVQRII